MPHEEDKILFGNSQGFTIISFIYHHQNSFGLEDSKAVVKNIFLLILVDKLTSKNIIPVNLLLPIVLRVVIPCTYSHHFSRFFSLFFLLISE